MNKRFTKNFALIILLFFLIPLGRTYGSSEPVNDIKGHWAEVDIQQWLDKSLITGYPDHTFRPDNVISRGEFVALVNRAFHYSDMSPISFKDLKQTNWAYIEVQKAINQGYISGFDDNTFRSEKTITRQETAVILSRILKLNNDKVVDAVPAEDSKLIPSWSKADIKNMLEKGIMSNYPEGTFQPQREMTRAESVVAINKALISSAVIYNKAGTFGDTALSTVHSDVIIQASGVTLKNIHILGDLIITKEVGDGESYLDKVKVEGITRIEGGGVNSIHIKNSQLGKLVVNRLSNIVRVIAEGSTTIQDTQILSSAIIEENDISGEGFMDVSVLPEMKETKTRKVLITGDFNNVHIGANVNEFTVRKGNIKSLVAKENLVISNIILNKDVNIQMLELKSKSTISGEGKISAIVLSEEAKDSIVSSDKTVTIPAPGGGTGGISGGGAGPGAGAGSGSGGGTGTVNPEPEEPALTVTKIIGANGTIEVVFNKSVIELPVASDFKILRKINQGEFEKVDVGHINLLENKTTVKLTVPSLGSSDEDQVVVYSLSYKDADPLLSESVAVPKSSTIVTGALYHLNYNETKPFPVYKMNVHLTGVNETTSTYTSGTDVRGTYTFENVQPGTYIINIYIGLTRYYTDPFTISAGQKLTIPDIVIKEKAPVPSVDKVVYTDIGYLSGSVMNLKEPFYVKVELEDGTVLKTLPGKYDTFFSLDLFAHNPGLVLKDKDKLFVTLYTSEGWTSERLEVDVVERPKTKAPVVTSVVYDDSKIIRGTVESNETEITITRMDGTVIGKSYNNYGTFFNIYLYESQLLTAGEKLVVYAQDNWKRKSDPVYITVIAPTVVTSQPEIDGPVYENAWHITGTAEAESIIYIKRSNGTVIGKGKAQAQEYGSKFDIELSPRPVAGETLYVSAKGYEQIISDAIPVIVENRPITPTPSIVGEVYSDSIVIQAIAADLPAIQLFLKDMNGNTIADGYGSNGVFNFYYFILEPNKQYQLTAIAFGLKESEPYIFTAKVPTEMTPIPTVTTPVYADVDYKIFGLTDPYATVYLYYENGELIYSNQANGLGEFTFTMPSNPPVLPGAKIVIRADGIGKLISEDLVLTAISPAEKSNPPVLNNNQVYGYTNVITGRTAVSSIVKVFHEDGRLIDTGYTDMNTGNFSVVLWSAILRGGEKIYLVTDEAGKLPSDPLYITIESVPKADTPIITTNVSTGSQEIEGTYDGERIVANIITTIFLYNENNQVIGMSYLEEDGSFSIDLQYNPLVTGQIVKVFVKEGQKEASDPVVIVVN